MTHFALVFALHLPGQVSSLSNCCWFYMACCADPWSSACSYSIAADGEAAAADRKKKKKKQKIKVGSGTGSRVVFDDEVSMVCLPLCA